MIPGELFIDDGEIELNAGRETIVVNVANGGDRPIQVGSHYHFAETNNALRFDRARARGFRLNIPAGTAVRFEPGQEKEVELVSFGGERALEGLNLLTAGGDREAALGRAREGGYGGDPTVSPVQVGAGEAMMNQALINLYTMLGKFPKNTIK